jgi:hypothetical protein
MRDYMELARMEREGFTVIVDKTWEDIDVGDCFDDTCYDIQEMRDKINSYDLDWFMLRVRVLLDDHELASAYLGGCLYEDAREVLKDGTAEDLIHDAVLEAMDRALELRDRIVEMCLEERMEKMVDKEPA